MSFDLVQRIAGNPGSEVIITMQPQYFSRFDRPVDGILVQEDRDCHERREAVAALLRESYRDGRRSKELTAPRLSCKVPSKSRGWAWSAW